MVNQTLQVILQAANALAVIILVVITLHYARSTWLLVREAAAQRELMERQAAVAEQTLAMLRDDRKHERAVAVHMVRTEIFAVEALLIHLDPTRRQNVDPTEFALYPKNASQVLEYARSVSVSGAEALADAFRTLSVADAQLRVLSELRQQHGTESKEYLDACLRYDDIFVDARAKLDKAANELVAA